ncbi:hypothetical protein H312_03200 [Anncaliia algerae PRA339]|uniref:Uncharacterized protein n=1 Tax=Anncaliia algerae PRA339 TaxID=1288291 RepID=A0A059EX12_9MICR|nr:hypothetical protein H312_03200 [Anncaliia algerae PRA339]
MIINVLIYLSKNIYCTTINEEHTVEKNETITIDKLLRNYEEIFTMVSEKILVIRRQVNKITNFVVEFSKLKNDAKFEELKNELMLQLTIRFSEINLLNNSEVMEKLLRILEKSGDYEQELDSFFKEQEVIKNKIEEMRKLNDEYFYEVESIMNDLKLPKEVIYNSIDEIISTIDIFNSHIRNFIK